MEIMINNYVVFLFSATNEDFYQSELLFIVKILLVVKMMRCDAITSRQDVTTRQRRMGNGEREMKNGNKPNFNPSPISKFISNSLFVPIFFIFPLTVLVSRSPPFPVLVTSSAKGHVRKF